MCEQKRIFGPRWLATDRSKAIILCKSYFMLFGVGVLCRVLCCLFCYLLLECEL